MTALGEERCRDLVGKLCFRFGWSVRPVPGVHKVLFTGKNRWVAFGWTWSEVFACFYDNVHVFTMSPDIPAWTRLCGSPEELALKIEVML